MSRVGYAYDADVHCVDCTIAYAGAIPETQYLFGNYKYPEDYQDSDGVFQVYELIDDGIIRDSENNELHPVFDSEETDTPQHCTDCGEYIDTTWTQECQNYVVEAFGRFIEGYIYPDSGEGGSAEVLDVWAEYADPSNAKNVYCFIRNFEREWEYNMATSVITPFKCYLCEQWKGDTHKEYTMEFSDGESVDVCNDCQENELTHRHDGDIRTVVLEKMAGLGMEDDYMSAEGWGYCGRFDNYLLFCDTQGFWSSSEYPTAEAADKYYVALHNSGMGYFEGDATIYEDRGVYHVYMEGKEIGKVDPYDGQRCPNPLRRAKAMVSLEMRRTGFYPNVWLSDDRSMHRIDVW